MHAPEPQPEAAGLPMMVGFNIFSVAKKVEDVEVWPENMPAVNLFVAVGTQWRVGMVGPVGLDYPAAFAMIDRLHRDKTEAEKDALFDDLQVMEREALAQMARNAPK